MVAPALALHGGCGTAAATELPAELWEEMRQHLAAALRRGWAALAGGGSAVDAVEAAVVALEERALQRWPRRRARRGRHARAGCIDHGRARARCRRGERGAPPA